MEKIVYNVARSTATGKHVNVGDFGSIQAAHDAMIEHYRHTPKRGKFAYTITQQKLQDIGGQLMRVQCLVLCGENKPYYRKYLAAELGAMVI